MKVLHVIDLMAVGGAQFLIKGIFETYQNKDHYLFVLRHTNNLIEVDHPNVYFAGSRSKYGLGSLFELKKFIKKNKIDVIHAYLLKSQIFSRILKQFWFSYIKLVFHEHGEIFINNAPWYIRFMKKSEKFVNLYFATSDSTAEALNKKTNISVKKIVSLYNYVVLENFSKDKISINVKSEKKNLGIKPDEFVIGFAGRLSYEKGPVHLINALPHIKHKYKLVIAGAGDQLELLKERINELNLNENVIFLGFVKDMINTYALFDSLIIPSEHESFGLVAVEAQSMGIPVVASDVPGLNEVVLELKSGLQFKSKDHIMMAEKINLLIEDKVLYNDLKNKGKIFAQQYDIDTYYNKMLSSYKEILTKR